MQRVPGSSAFSRLAIVAVAALVVGYLGLVALFPWIPEHLPYGLDWFGRPKSAPTFTLGVAALAAVCVVVYQTSRGRRSGASIGLVVVLSVTSLLLALASYLPCGSRGRTPFFTPFIWATALVRGNTGDIATPDGSCPALPRAGGVGVGAVVGAARFVHRVARHCGRGIPIPDGSVAGLLRQLGDRGRRRR